MRKFIAALFTAFSLLTFTSCDTYAQGVVYDDGFVYEYSYNNYPVRYINGVAYYYCLYNNVWSWIILDRMYYDRIIHHPHPVRYAYRNYPGRHYHYNHRPHPRHINPDMVSPHAPYDRGSGFNRPNNHTTRPSTGGSVNHGSGFGGSRSGGFGQSGGRGGRR